MTRISVHIISMQGRADVLTCAARPGKAEARACACAQAPNYIAMFYDQMDAHLLGGTQWGWTDNFNPYTKDGWNQENFSVTDQHRNLRSNFAIRPYPRAIAGVPGSFQVPPSTMPIAASSMTLPQKLLHAKYACL